MVVAVRLQVVRIEVAVVVPVSVNEAVPVPTEVMTAVMKGEPAAHTGTQSADVDSADSAGATETHSADMNSAGAPETQSADMNSTKAARVADTDSATMSRAYSADVTSESTTSESAGVASAKPAATMASGSAAASTARLCRGCNNAAGERAGEQYDDRSLQHFPVPVAWPPTWLAAIAIGTTWCDRTSAVFRICGLLCALAAIRKSP